MPRVLAAVVGAGHGSCHDKLHPMPRGICACFRAALEPPRAAARAGCRGFRAAGVLRPCPAARGRRGSAVCGARGRPPLRPDLPLAPGSLPLAAVGESPGMTVRNTRAFASRGGACECYFYILSVVFEGWPPAAGGTRCHGRGLDRHAERRHAPHGTARHGTARHGTARHGRARFAPCGSGAPGTACRIRDG